MRNIRTTWMAMAVAMAMQALAAAEAEAAEGSRSASVRQTERVPRRIVVSIPDRKLAVLEHDSVLRLFDVAVGSAKSPSPTGTFTIVNRIDRPTYYAPGKVVPPSARNPLGTRWLGLSAKGYGIHGTDVPGSIGHARSHGCIRLRNQDIEKLFEMVRAGDVVELHGERTVEVARILATQKTLN